MPLLKKSPHETGQSLVEIALVLPVLIILFLGIAEVGFLLFAQVQVANATREGARYGSLCRLNHNCFGSGYTLTDVVQSAVLAEAQPLKMNGSNTTVNVQPASLSAVPPIGTPITVTVTYTHTPPFISGLVPMFPSKIPVQHIVVMHFDK
jgi:Flp pilus assembly protein TadG